MCSEADPIQSVKEREVLGLIILKKMEGGQAVWPLQPPGSAGTQ